MITLELPDTPRHRFTLQESVRQFRGKPMASASMEQMGSWVELSEVTSVTLTEDKIAEDKGLTRFFDTQRDEFRFDYIRFGCTFHPYKREAFNQAWLAIRLERENGRQKGGPTVWSMHPDAEYDVTCISAKASIGAELKLISGEVGSEREIKQKDYFLRAYREGKGAPFWEFISTKQTPINGSYLLHMIVRSNIKDVILGEVELTTTIEHRKFLIIPSVKDFKDKPVRNFHLPFSIQQAASIYTS